MIRLALYPMLPQAAVSLAHPTAVDHDCERCELHQGRRTVCMAAEGAPGGLLVVAESPGKIEDQMGRGFAGAAGKYVRSLVAKHWGGPVAYDHGVRCQSTDAGEKEIAACRVFGARILLDVQPTRILCLGNAAVEAVLGHRPPLASAQRGYGFVFTALDDAIPVFFLPAAAFALRNRFVKADFERDFQHVLTCPAPEPDFDEQTNLIETRGDAELAVRVLQQAPWFSYDVETSGKMGNPDFRIEALTAMGFGQGDAYTWTREALRDPSMTAKLTQLLADRTVGKTTQNGKYDDRSVLCALSVNVEGTRFDTRLGRKLLAPESDARLDTLAYLVGLGGHKDEAGDQLAIICKELRRLANPPAQLTPKGNVRKIKPPLFRVEESVLQQIRDGEDAMAFAFRYLDPTTLYRYNARDVQVTLRCGVKLEAELAADPQTNRVWRELTVGANTAVRAMEHWGIACDRRAVEMFSIYCEARIKDATKTIEKHVPGLNPNSPKQVGDFLFNKLGLKSWKETKSGAQSTDNEVLESLAHKHPAINALVKSRKYTKLNGTYARGMLIHIREDGRIHPSILIDGTRTLRFSCTDPNLQNIPRAEGDDAVEAAMARNCFIAPPGSLLLELDYAQIEVKVAAMLAGDAVMIADINSGIDIHMNNATACCTVAWGIPRAQWDAMDKAARKPYRSKIKTATFAKLYGKTTSALAREWGAPKAEVEKIDAVIWGRYKRLAKWCEEQIAQARRVGYVETWWDGQAAYRRPLHKVADPEENVRKHGENEAVNTPVQGTAAHFMSASLPRVLDWIRDDGAPAKLVLTVHDSMMLEVKEKYVDEVAHAARDIMCSHNSSGVKITADAKVGTAWGSMQDYVFK